MALWSFNNKLFSFLWSITVWHMIFGLWDIISYNLLAIFGTRLTRIIYIAITDKLGETFILISYSVDSPLPVLNASQVKKGGLIFQIQYIVMALWDKSYLTNWDILWKPFLNSTLNFVFGLKTSVVCVVYLAVGRYFKRLKSLLAGEVHVKLIAWRCLFV